MCTIKDRNKTALVVIDMQKDIIAKAYQRDEVIANISSLIQKARLENVPVIFVQHSDNSMTIGSDGWQFVSELAHKESEVLIHKKFGDSFEDTSLESELAKLNVGHLVITGAQTDACIRSTLHGAFTRGYDTTLVSDAHTTEDLSEYGIPKPDQLIAFTNMYWTWQAAPGRKAHVTKTAEIQF